MASARSREIRFGVFVLDAASGELLKNGTRVRLQEQPLQVLKALVERPGKVVTREELQQLLWPDGTFVDFDDGLATAVRKVRNALDDSATNPRFVETLPRRGYRFIAPVEDTGIERALERASASHEQLEKSPSQKGPARYAWASAALAVAVIVGAFLLYHLSDSRGDLPDLSQFAEAPVTSYLGEETGPSFSPDGRRLAFSWTGETGDNPDIYVKLVAADSDAPSRLTHDPAIDFSPSWSPDESSIAFLRYSPSRPDATTLMLMDSLGGGKRRVHELSSLAGLREVARLHQISEIAWSPDGRYLAFPGVSGVERSVRSIGLVPVGGGDVRWLTNPREGFGDGDPAFSPDGRTLAFVRRSGWGSGHEVFVLRLSEQYAPEAEAQRVTDFARSASSPAWTPDGETLVFLGESSPGRKGVWALSSAADSEPRLIRPDSRIHSLPTANTLAIAPGPSGKGIRLAYTLYREDSDIGQVSLANSNAGEVSTLQATNAFEARPSVSPDNRSVAFLSRRSGPSEIWISSRDGANARQLTRLGSERAGWPSWSPSGDQIVFQARPEGQADVYLADPETGRTTRLTSSPADDDHPSWSRDGRWVYFTSTRSGSLNIWRKPIGGGDAERLTTHVSSRPQASWDGTKLVYPRPDRHELWFIPLDRGQPSGPPELLGSLPGEHRYLVMAPGGLYHQHDGKLVFFDLASRTRRDLFDFADSPNSLSADGMFLLFERWSLESDLVLLEAP